MKTIDLETWPRKSQYAFFKSLGQPHFSMTAEVDITTFVGHLKPQGVPVFNACLFAVMQACNSIPEFRLRIRGNDVVEHEMVHPGITVPIEGNRFAFSYFDHTQNWKEFNQRCSSAVETGKQQTELMSTASNRDDLIFTTCLPWISFTALTHPVQGPEDSFPRVGWGKFHQKDDRWLLPVSVQVHHALADGFHLGLFYKLLQEAVDSLAE